MTIVKTPLNETDKKLLKRALKLRVIIGLIFLPALLPGVSIMFYAGVHDLIDGSYDGMSFFEIALTLIVFLLMYKFVIPFYKNSFKNVHIQNKSVVTTRILHIEDNSISKGPKYTVVTDYMTINSWSVSILQPILLFPDMVVNMMIEIHLLENSRTDILYIKKIQ